MIIAEKEIATVLFECPMAGLVHIRVFVDEIQIYALFSRGVLPLRRRALFDRRRRVRRSNFHLLPSYYTAAAPPTISAISCVMLAWRDLL